MVTLRYQDISVPLTWSRSVSSQDTSGPSELSDGELLCSRSFQLVLHSTAQPTVMSRTRVSSMPACGTVTDVSLTNQYADNQLTSHLV